MLPRVVPTARQAAPQGGRAVCGGGAPAKPAPRVTPLLRAAIAGRANPGRVAGLPAPAASQKTVGSRLREEEVGVTWVPLDQTKEGLSDGAVPASCTIALRLDCEEELLELASPGLRQLPCKKHGREPRIAPCRYPVDCRPHGLHCQPGPLRAAVHQAQCSQHVVHSVTWFRARYRVLEELVGGEQEVARHQRSTWKLATKNPKFDS